MKNLILTFIFATPMLSHAAIEFRNDREYTPFKEAYDQHRDKLLELYTTDEGGMNPRLGTQHFLFLFEERSRPSEMSPGTILSSPDGWIQMDEGALRFKKTTKDGIAAMICWGFGLPMGGAPPWPHLDYKISSWAQSAYYAAAKCMKALFEKDENVQIVKKMEIHPLVEAKCSTQFRSDANKAAMCMRIAHAGRSFAQYYSILEGRGETIDLGLFDSQVAEQPRDRYRRFSPQCLANTYFAGALCDKDPREHPSDDDYKTGYCKTGSIGGRPPCWFNPEDYVRLTKR